MSWVLRCAIGMVVIALLISIRAELEQQDEALRSSRLFPRTLPKPVDKSLPGFLADHAPTDGSVLLYQTNQTMERQDLINRLGSYYRKPGVFFWTGYGRLRRPGNGAAMLTAMGFDNKQHFVNSYLEGYIPFKTDNLFAPLMHLARKKTYMRDLAQNGVNDVWQTSRQAYYYTRGDCEDHAVALADWLIEMGEDARVAVGQAGGEGHAWVILIKDDKEYIMEATSKGAGARRYPLASTQPSYIPQYQFNREAFWSYKGKAPTRVYRSRDWIEQSRYQRAVSN